jgi:GH15 family glucan-1,4-alpha-glucosidase
MYGPAGERWLPELELHWLSGYEGSTPVRIGNLAADQFQLDVYGEVMDALHIARRAAIGAPDAGWALQRLLMEFLESHWHEPDQSIWEVRGPRRQFTYSKVLAWVAADRAVKAVERSGLDGPLARWKALRAEIHDDVCAEGYNAERATFTQYYGADHTDASLLLLPLVGFLPATDERMVGTVRAVERELSRGGLLMRSRERAEDVDGLPEGEGAFIACSFWLADNLVLQGRHDEAEALFHRLLGLRNDVGLLSEEYDPDAGRMLGNFPQAFSHVSLVNTAHNLGRDAAPIAPRQ